jgi:putative DNA primase/helicase
VDFRHRCSCVDARGLVNATNGSNSDDEAIASLAALPLREYERQRKEQAKRLGYRAPVLDKLVEKRRTKGNGALQGSAVICPDVEPWPERVDGAAVLSEVAETFACYVALPQGAADALALWCVHTYCFETFTCSPRLHVTSPERGCGKSTCRDVVALFVRRPFLAENLTTATAFRLVEEHQPTILADECDSWLRGNAELTSILNSGHRCDGCVPRCVGDNQELKAFRTYGPAGLFGIGALPGTLHDRSIVVRLERAKPGELQARFDSRRADREKEINRKLARWCADNRDRIGATDPVLPEGVFNRLADNWRPLFAIAEILGEDWPKRCGEALAKLTRGNDPNTESLRVSLLADIREVFDAKWGTARMFSRDLIDALQQMSERPWPEVNRGKPITERWLARSLAAFDIHSKTLRIGEERAKGYELADFTEAFERYLPEEGDSIRDSVTSEGEPPSLSRDKTEASRDTSKNVTDEKITPTEGKSRCHAYAGGAEQNTEGEFDEW